MGRKGSGHGPRCEICGEFFTPDPRQCGQQRLCGKKSCRQEYKKRWQRNKYHADREYRKSEKQRVKKWRSEHPGYWKGPGRVSGADPPVDALIGAVTAEIARVEETLNGLASHTAGCGDSEQLRELLTRCRERGREVMKPDTGMMKSEKSERAGKKVGCVTGHVIRHECGSVTGHVSSVAFFRCRLPVRASEHGVPGAETRSL